MIDLALFVLRATLGGLLAGHGAQKLFGTFEGPGLQGTTGWMESMGLKPGKQWAVAASASEFGGGVLMILGLLNPLGPIASLGSMGMATAKVHWGRPIWVTQGGAELPLTNIAVATALSLAGPGKYSLDNALGIRLPRWIVIPGAALAIAGVVYGVKSSEANQAPAQQAETSAA